MSDGIHQGSKLQRELPDVLLRFRRNPLALMCDIAEMYLKTVEVTKDRPYERSYENLLKQERVPTEYEFNLVFFGINCLRFQAQFVAQKHADNSRNEFPVAAEAVLKSTSCSFTKSWMRSKPTKECKPINGCQICPMFWKGYQPRLDQEKFALPVILLMNSCNTYIFSN